MRSVREPGVGEEGGGGVDIERDEGGDGKEWDLGKLRDNEYIDSAKGSFDNIR